jgi:RNA polymerase sigma-70 factor (ECF subfamily)
MRRSRNAHKQVTKCLPTTAERMLVARCKAGNHAAFVELIQQGSPIARRAIRSIVRNTADVDDVMQDTAIAVFRGFRSFNERSKFSTWMTRIAINNALMLLRRQKNKREISLDFEGRESDATPFPHADKTDDPERALIRQQSIESVRKAVHALPRTLREYAERRCLEELSNLETASALRITCGAEKSRYLRVRQSLESSLVSL